MSNVDNATTHRSWARHTLVLGGALVLMSVALWFGWLSLASHQLSVGAQMLREDETELPDDIPPLPSELTYGERADLLPSMIELPAASADEIERIFDALEFAWPPEGPVPAVAIMTFPQAMDELEVERRKALFFRSLLPMIMAENQRMLETRQRVEEMLAQGMIAEESSDYRALATLGQRFRVDGDPNDDAFRESLLRRIDAVPVDMALAQAANESGWGTSRFTREANNLFGVWTWQPDQGLVPEQRAEGATHRVRIFPNLQASVRNYVYTINVGDAYHEFRLMRAQARGADAVPRGEQLATTLTNYSERGEDYVAEIQSMIRYNSLNDLDETLELWPADNTVILQTESDGM
ncbi:Bax protein [Natronocella acetinitrilica]|jgi:Bax protein|uniref:Bax protein n=1 Tax=Natronocella acetinitrilica TaxID=414046 RepID=A0AAE3KEE4_9GAMM|nr:glucosaminidase domain-containing protein [Natronocella acetinitrilica]MCP1672997.1 Bax protein [Natronocella acetinitrilica]